MQICRVMMVTNANQASQKFFKDYCRATLLSLLAFLWFAKVTRWPDAMRAPLRPILFLRSSHMATLWTFLYWLLTVTDQRGLWNMNLFAIPCTRRRLYYSGNQTQTCSTEISIICVQKRALGERGSGEAQKIFIFWDSKCAFWCILRPIWIFVSGL